MVVAGVAMVVLNQPRSYREEPSHDVQIDIAPWVSGDGAGAAATFQFQ